MLRSLPLLLGCLCLCSACGMNPSVLSLNVEPDRKIVYETKSKITVELDGVISENASLSQTLLWQMTFGPKANGKQSVQIECQGVEVEGKAKGQAYDGPMLKTALEALKLTLMVDSKGRTVSISETDLSGQGPAISNSAAAATAGMRSIGPLGIAFSEESLKPNLTWKLEVDILQAMPQWSSLGGEKSGSSELVFTYQGDENLAGRTVARIGFVQTGSLSALLTIKGAPTAIKGKITGKGTFWVDRRSGLVLKSAFEGESNTDVGTGTLVQKEKGETLIKSSPE